MKARPLGLPWHDGDALRRPEAPGSAPGPFELRAGEGAFVSTQSRNVLLQSLERDGVVTRPAEAAVGKRLRPSA